MKPRGRPKKRRLVRANPKISQFSPRGKPGRPDEMDLALDEFEVIRLVDYMGFDQKEAAKSMLLSQQSISRILKRARKKLANAIINGNIIKIEEVHYAIKSNEELQPDNLQT